VREEESREGKGREGRGGPKILIVPKIPM